MNKNKAAGLSMVAASLGVLHACATAPETRETQRATTESAVLGAPKVTPLPGGLHYLPQPSVAPPVSRNQPETVKVSLETKPVTALTAEGIAFEYWAYNGTVPGPMIRVRQGDTVELTLKNSSKSRVSHSIDLHAATGPGGGGKVTQTPPGGTSVFRFKALNPGVYIYHCATPMIPYHIGHGLYGLMVVEPPGGWPRVDREFYVVQGDFYLAGDPAEVGLHDAVVDKMLKEEPDYIVFNGAVGSLAKSNAFKARVGETVRIFFGVAGPNITSSFHVIGEIFDRVYPEGASEPLGNVQSTLVPAGGTTIVDFKINVPGTYILVDHSLGRLQKGAAGFLDAQGDEDPAIFHAVVPGDRIGGGH